MDWMAVIGPPLLALGIANLYVTDGRRWPHLSTTT